MLGVAMVSTLLNLLWLEPVTSKARPSRGRSGLPLSSPLSLRRDNYHELPHRSFSEELVASNHTPQVMKERAELEKARL